MSETVENIQLKKELASISGKPNHIQIDAIKTKEAYDKALAEKGIVPTSKRDYPRSDQGYLAIPSKYDKLIISMRTAYAKELSLDKGETSYDDLLDALRLSLKGYKIE